MSGWPPPLPEPVGEAPEAALPEAAPESVAEAGEKNGQRKRRRRRGGKRDDKATAEDPAAVAASDPDGEVGPLAAADDSAAAATELPAQETIAFPATDASADGQAPLAGMEQESPDKQAGAEDAGQPASDEDDPDRPRRRGRRGGRRRRKTDDDAAPAEAAASEAPAALPEQPAETPSRTYRGPTPANPFAGQGFDVFEAMEQAEERRAADAALMATQPAPEAAPETVPEAPPREDQPVTPGAPAELADATEAETATRYVGPLPTGVHYDPSIAGPAAPPAEAGQADALTTDLPETRTATIQIVAPILIGATESAGERKRGWWRR